MRICHITPHLPPDQAANALLPFHLGCWGNDAGRETTYVAHPARWASGSADLPGPVTWIPSRDRTAASWFVHKLRGAGQALRIAQRVDPVIRDADLVHLHSNGLLVEIGARVARRHRKPTVLTLYGTEIWHYRRRRPIDLFTRAYDEAGRVTFYSEGLRQRAATLGLRQDHALVIYPPAASAFVWNDPERRAAARAALGLHASHVLLNVKRLHPLAGQRHAIDALVDIVQTHPDVQLVICGAGALRAELEAQAGRHGVGAHVRFAGLVDNSALAAYYAAADVFLLPSLLEAAPTVAFEALASGTPVISADHPGGVELRELFGDDIAIVPRENAPALARAVTAFLNDKRRTSESTRERIERELRPEEVARRFGALYEALVDAPADSAATSAPAAGPGNP